MDVNREVERGVALASLSCKSFTSCKLIEMIILPERAPILYLDLLLNTLTHSFKKPSSCENEIMVPAVCTLINLESLLEVALRMLANEVNEVCVSEIRSIGNSLLQNHVFLPGA